MTNSITIVTMTASHCVKSDRIQSYSGPRFPAFELNTERYSVSVLIQSERVKIRTIITMNTFTFYAVFLTVVCCNLEVV